MKIKFGKVLTAVGLLASVIYSGVVLADNSSAVSMSALSTNMQNTFSAMTMIAHTIAEYGGILVLIYAIFHVYKEAKKKAMGQNADYTTSLILGGVSVGLVGSSFFLESAVQAVAGASHTAEKMDGSDLTSALGLTGGAS